jgi:2-dehydro-3-deoxyglucarate aldolase/4-hydroxy-2-oxoheptanedioate aldolase
MPTSLTNPVRSALEEGRTVLGTFVMEFATGGFGSIAAQSGADFVFLDQQHTGWSLGELSAAVWGCHAAGVPLGIRVPAAEPWLIGAALDTGATLIMVPSVSSAAEAARIVEAVRYPPYGRRALTTDFASDRFDPPGDLPSELRRRDADTVVVAQIEDREGLENAAEIAAVDGVDVLWVGDGDLSTSLGIPGRLADPGFLAALDTVASAATRAGKSAGITTADPAFAADAWGRGFDVICCGNDIKLMSRALAGGIASFRDAIAGTHRPSPN